MVMIETRQAAKDKAFDLLYDIKDLDYLKKMILCKLEETLYECFESEEDDEEEYENSEYTQNEDDDKDIDYRSRKSYRYRKNMRSMRGDHDMYDEDMDNMPYRSMRMRRRNRMGRFV